MSEVGQPQGGIAYTPEQVHANHWLGNITPSAMRKAAQAGKFQHTRLRGKILFTAEDIAAILAAGRVPAKDETPHIRATARRVRRTPSLTDVPHGVTPLVAKPARPRGSRAS
jgi:hypothetical protein